MTLLPQKCALWQPQIGAVAGRQWGVASARQLQRRGVTRAAIRWAVATGRLHVAWRGVFSVVPPGLLSMEGRLAAAVLAGGRGAVLCHLTAAAWLRLIPSMPPTIHIAVRTAREPIAGIEFHEIRLRPDERGKHNRMPVTSPARTALDVATSEPLWTVRKVLAELEYHHGLEAADLLDVPRNGHPGSTRLREAIATPARLAIEK